MALPLSFEDAAAEVLARSKALLHAAQGSGVKYADLFLETSASDTMQAETRRANQFAPAYNKLSNATTGLAIRSFDAAQQELIHVPDWSPGEWMDAAGSLGRKFPRRTGLRSDFRLPDVIQWWTMLPADAAHAVPSDTRQHVLAGMLEMVHTSPEVLRARATLQVNHRQTLVVNTEAQAIGQQQAAFGVRLDVWDTAGRHTWGQAGYQAGFGELAFEGGAQLVQDVLTRNSRQAEVKPVRAGVWPVVFAGGWPGVWLHETVGHLLEADVLPDHLALGDSIGPAGLTVYDDPGMPAQRGTYAVDDEGCPGKRTLLVEDGKLQQVLNDRFFASRRGEAATGHGRRMHYFHVPAPRMSNLGLASGTVAPRALLDDVREGLYVLRAGAGRVDAATDTVTLDVQDGYWIEKGRLAHPVSDVRITASRFAMLQNLAGVATDVMGDHGTGVCEKAGQLVPVSVNTPTVLITGLALVQLKTGAHAG